MSASAAWVILTAVIDLLSANETFDGHRLRAWTGVAVDEGVGLLAIVEVSDAAGRTLARLEEFLDARARTRPRRDCDEGPASLNGHRFEM